VNLATLSSSGQITVPREIRSILHLKSGDKILFLQKPSGEIVIGNASAQSVCEEVQRTFKGVAREMCGSDETAVSEIS
jgi:AbrB family looped-hinge helix DNA binding protein